MKTLLPFFLLFSLPLIAQEAEPTPSAEAINPPAEEKANQPTRAEELAQENQETLQEVLAELRSIKRDMIVLKAEFDALNRRVGLIIAQQDASQGSFEDMIAEDPALAVEKIITIFEAKDFDKAYRRSLMFLQAAPEHERAEVIYTVALASFRRVNMGDYQKTMDWRKENGSTLYARFREMVNAGQLGESAIKQTLSRQNPHEVREIVGMTPESDPKQPFAFGNFTIDIEFDNGRVEALEVTPIEEPASED